MKPKHRSACHNHSAGGGGAGRGRQLIHVDGEMVERANGAGNTPVALTKNTVDSIPLMTYFVFIHLKRRQLLANHLVKSAK